MKVESMDNGEWEDIPEVNTARSSRTLSVPPSPASTRMATRRRKTPHKKTNLTPPLMSRRSATPAAQLQEETPAYVDREQIQQAVFTGASAMVSYVMDVLGTAFWLLKKPLGVLAFFVALGFLCGYVVEKFRFMLTPVCILPGIRSSILCQLPSISKSANFTKLVEVEDNFEGIINANVGTSELSLKLKQSEIVTRDLVTLVRVSDLKSRDTLAEALMQFVEDAKKTGEGLHRLSAKINGAVDRVAHSNSHAMRTIGAAIEKSVFSLSRLLTPFTSGSTEAAVLRSFEDAMDTLAQGTQRALFEASVSVANLELLQEHLFTIHELCSREGVVLSEEHEQLLSELWTKLGGNNQKVRKHEVHLALLKEVGRYRREALAHVVVTRDALQAVEADVAELRATAAAAGIAGDRIAPQALIGSIGDGIQRLKDKQLRANELQQAMVDRFLASSSDVLGIEGDRL
ncbi:uncharacterized protein C8Q71DRAFT_295509 [Rhodofomes roseus]|uniref:Uncharacterized protein n=1 Tax=Rhodofomes roseus TaxID=34475 RepID=A0ABQ8K454_9APHY|nr:uncharacterized protein C8Q71DRAFT_295509 [Rhodofomes roseus]KAH9831615.1 hypothetical protein C8Q71DRAFT_295509 [Rhodofomes roseus]